MGCDRPRTYTRLAPGDIVFVYGRFSATLARVECVTATDDGDRYDVLFNDGTHGSELRREALGDRITSEGPQYGPDVMGPLIFHTVRDIAQDISFSTLVALCYRLYSGPGHELFSVLTDVRKHLLRKRPELASRA